MNKLHIAVANIPEETQNYFAALHALNVVPVTAEIPTADGFDGLLIPGGGDISPCFFGQDNQGSYDIDITLDRFQLDITDRFVSAGKPILGICRGEQVLNVYFGGSLIQDLPNSDCHRQIKGEDNVHLTHTNGDNYLRRLYGESFYTNSAHHQAIDRIGDGLKILQYSADGIIEAVCHESLPIFAYQWHPERMCFSKRREDTVDGSIVLRHYLDQC